MKKIPASVSKEAATLRKLRPVPIGKPATRIRASRNVSADENPMEDIRDAVSKLKRERIILTAVELFHNNGLGKTTLEAVARKMNVTKPFIYSHFKSKDDLLAEICSRGIRSSLDVLNRVALSEGSATEKFHAMAHDFMLAVIENQAHIAIYTREEKHLSTESRDAINQMRREFDRKICALLDEGIVTGEFIVDDVQLASLAIGGIIGGSYVWYRQDGRLTANETAERVADLALAMIHAKTERHEQKGGKARRAGVRA